MRGHGDTLHLALRSVPGTLESAQPSRERVLRLSRYLEIPPREQNLLLLSAGLAPYFHGTPLGDQRFESAGLIIDLILGSHEPYRAIAIDQCGVAGSQRVRFTRHF